MNVSATCIDPKARNSCITEFASACTIRGTKTAIIASAPSATTATNQWALRHPIACPIQVTRGTPATFAIGMPSITRPTARPACPAGARSMATSVATPK